MIYIVLNTTGDDYLEIFFEDDDNKELYAGDVPLNTTKLDWGFADYQETTTASDLQFGVTGNGTLGDCVLHIQEELSTLGVTDYDLDINVTISGGVLSHLGPTADDSESEELIYNGATDHNLGTKDEDHRTYYGVVVLDPDSNGAGDKVELKVPSDVLEATIVVSGTGTTATSGGDTIRQVVPVSTAVAKLDSEVSDAATVGKDLVLVGGPAVNSLTAEAMGLDYPTYGASGLLPIEAGEGYIEYMDGVFAVGQDVVVVFGWAAENTRDATSVLQQVDSFVDSLDGNMAVKVTDVSSAGITAV
jgi:hypothetical protein